MKKSIDGILARVAEEAEEGELMVSDDHAPLPAGTKVTRGHNRSRTLQIRLNGDELEQLELIAKAEGLPVSTVARGLILVALAPTSDPGATISRIESELAALKQAFARG